MLRVNEPLEKTGVSAELEKRKAELVQALGDARANRQDLWEPRLKVGLKDFGPIQM